MAVVARGHADPGRGRHVLELVHEAHVDPDLWGQFGPGAVGVGWDLGLMGLGLHIETGAAGRPAEGVAFPTTPGGVAFVRRAATEWADAAIGDGDEPGRGEEAAEPARPSTQLRPRTVPEAEWREPSRPSATRRAGRSWSYCRGRAAGGRGRRRAAGSGADLAARRLAAPQGAPRRRAGQGARRGHTEALRPRRSRARCRPGLARPARRSARAVLATARRAGDRGRTRPQASAEEKLVETLPRGSCTRWSGPLQAA